MKIFLLLPITIFALQCFAQRDSLRSEILHYSNEKQELISKGRMLLLQKLEQKDFTKVKEIRNYLQNEVANEEYAAFYSQENTLLLYWTKEYDLLLQEFQSGRNEVFSHRSYPPDLGHRIYPESSELLPRLYAFTVSSATELEISIGYSDLNKEQKDFLVLTLENLISLQQPERRMQVNNLADRYLNSYPHSTYNDYIRKNIRYVFKPSDWGLAFEFFTGYGVLTDSLSNRFTNTIPIGIAFDIQYKKWIFYLRDFIGFSKTKQDINYASGLWKKSSQVRVFLPELTIGYQVVDNNRLKLAPFAGISATDIGPTQYDVSKNPDLENAELKFSTTWTTGINTDIKLGHPKTGMISYGAEDAFTFLRIRYTFNAPSFSHKYPGMVGNLHYITIGIGGFGRKLKRII